LALLQVLATEKVDFRYDRVVIGSGDGIFAFPAARLQAAGCEVTVVTRPDALSRSGSGECRALLAEAGEETSATVGDVA
jgi:NAD(P)-dependent dehydrogenase (short-subunit alcohol dehydrogenase family)